jgi:drug/metabolite transporter (DMT)-like permease
VFLIAAIIAALAASACFAVSAVLEQSAAKRVRQRRMLDPRLLIDLIRYRTWLWSIVATIGGFALQVVALHFGPLALVQPILVCDLVFVVLLSAYLRGGRPDGVILAGVACCAAGIAVFLTVAQPTGGTESVSLVSAIPLAIGLAVVLAGCGAWARHGPAATRQLAYALACGVCYGANAFLIKVVTFSLGQGFGHPLTQWPLYGLLIVGPLGFLLNQEAYQRGPLIAPALAVITATDPLVSIAIAAVWLNESIANSPGALALEVASLGVMITGIVMLAHRAPGLARERAATDQGAAPAVARRPAPSARARRPAAAACAHAAGHPNGKEREAERVSNP